MLIKFLHPDGTTVRTSSCPTNRRGVSHDEPAVLFLCVHNAGRSQMALGWFNHLAAGRAVAWSGGSEPGNADQPVRDRGDGRGRASTSPASIPKPWTDEIVRAADVVITMGCGDACPFYPGKRYEDWALEDPAGQGVEAVRPIRDEIRERVTESTEEPRDRVTRHRRCWTDPVLINAVLVAVGVLVLLWIVLLVLLYVARPAGSTLADTARLIPDAFRMVRRLATDHTIPRRTRLPVWVLLAYLASPIDLVPDFVPIIGYADDAIITSLVLRRLIRKVGHDKLTEHWPGSTEGLDRLLRALRIAD